PHPTFTLFPYTTLFRSFDNSVNAWPSYDWMGVSKAALASIVRYLARDLGPYGIRVNAVSAGPMRTIAAKGVPGFGLVEETWGRRDRKSTRLNSSHGSIS